MDKVRFEAELIEGHKGVTVVLVPFDPRRGGRGSQCDSTLAATAGSLPVARTVSGSTATSESGGIASSS